jgi:predicted ATPase
MLTRLKVSGFKNLMGVDVRFGPFTCIAGPNAVGKSNLFDAIRFLSYLANKTLMEAALSVRSGKAASGDVRSLFHRVGGEMTEQMSFEVEMIAPRQAVDDLGQTGKAKVNFVRYALELRHRKSAHLGGRDGGQLEIVREELVPIHAKEVSKHLLFDHDIKQWRKTAIHIEHRAAPFISTKGEGDERFIYLHQDGGSRGRGISNPINQPRTVLSVANASESPTVLCARREMESWQMLQLEPSALREPDSINAPAHLEANGMHLPKTLYHLAEGAIYDDANAGTTKGDLPTPSWIAESAGYEKGFASREHAIYAKVANRLAELVDDVDRLEIDFDKNRESLTLIATDKDGTPHPARSLSDGTLRFLALAVLELDPNARGVICLEEPENGIHPERIPAMLNLLQDIATDPNEQVGRDNPLRQVIVNTHSPAVVLEVPDYSLLVVELRQEIDEKSGQQFRKAVFSHLPDTWREKADPSARVVPRGKLLSYLNPISPGEGHLDAFYARVGKSAVAAKEKRRPRVADRPEFQMALPLKAGER